MTLTIEGHVYEPYDGADLVAERYDDGSELHIEGVTSDLSQPVLAAFYSLGKRGGVHPLRMRGDDERMRVLANRMLAAGIHVRAVERWRSAYWGGQEKDTA